MQVMIPSIHVDLYKLILCNILILECDFCFNFNLKLNNVTETTSFYTWPLALHVESKMIILTSVPLHNPCMVSLNFCGKFCMVMHTIGKETEMIDVHQNLRVLSRLFMRWRSRVIDNHYKLLELHAVVLFFIGW